MSKKKVGMENGKDKVRKALARFVIVETIIFVFLVAYAALPYLELSGAVVGANNVTVGTLLQVGNVYPEIINFTYPISLSLTPNGTSNLEIIVIARDYNNDTDIQNLTLTFFDNSASSLGAADDNNVHYTNNSCSINYSYGDQYDVSANCTIPIWYYANNATWNATILVTDNATLTDSNSTLISISTLLALGLPDSIDYGIVNATSVSAQQIANVTNFGNTIFNLTLKGYGSTPNDNLSMNCTLGSNKNISINYEKYNLTASNDSALSLVQFEGIYLNLTSSSVTKTFNLPQRQNDTLVYVDETNATYWRIYVPKGVAGTCSGNIVFGAVQSTGS